MTARLLVALALLAPTPALADRASGEPGPQLAQVCAQGHAGHDGTVLCANYYLDAYNKAPTGPNADEHLYHAGTLFDTAGSVSAAVHAFELIGKQFPRSKYGPQALARTARIYVRVVMYDKAAAALEDYAMKYAGEKDAVDALSDAVYYRKAIGDDDKAIVDTKYFIKQYGTKRPDQAANAAFSLTSIYEKRGDHDAVIKHLREYIRVWGSDGGTDRLVIAHSKLGLLLWDRSCPVKPTDGLCTRTLRRRKPALCSGVTWGVEVAKRDDRLVKEAMKSLSTAATIFEGASRSASGDGPAALHYYARVLLAQHDAKAEATLYPKPPSVAVFPKWLEQQLIARVILMSEYEAIFATRDAATSIAAAHRIARVTDTFADVITDTGTTKAECESMAAEAAPLREQTKLAYGVCLAKAGELGWFDDSARSCERHAFRLAPREFPPLRELSGDPRYAAPVIATSGP